MYSVDSIPSILPIKAMSITSCLVGLLTLMNYFDVVVSEVRLVRLNIVYLSIDYL